MLLPSAPLPVSRHLRRTASCLDRLAPIFSHRVYGRQVDSETEAGSVAALETEEGSAAIGAEAVRSLALWRVTRLLTSGSTDSSPT